MPRTGAGWGSDVFTGLVASISFNISGWCAGVNRRIIRQFSGLGLYRDCRRRQVDATQIERLRSGMPRFRLTSTITGQVCGLMVSSLSRTACNEYRHR